MTVIGFIWSACYN